MRRGLILLLLVVVSLSLVTPANAAVPVGGRLIFVGDFESGNFGQWTQCQSRRYSGPCKGGGIEFYGMQVVSQERRQGQYAARFELRNGDKPRWGGGERAEVARYNLGRVHEGDERWYEFNLKFDAAFPDDNGKFLIVMQWHPDGNGSPPMALIVSGGQLFLTGSAAVGAPAMLIGDIARGEWVDYVVHAKFSRSAETGWAEVYRNGALAVPMHARANMVDNSNYLKMGLYRDDTASATAVLWVDGLRVTAP
jgi:Polysaccharide lyase